MSRRLIILLALLPSCALAQSPVRGLTAEQLLANAARLTGVDADGCLTNRAENEIVVCGMPEIDREQRLPFPALAAIPGERKSNPIPNGNPEIIQQGRCYITMNERNCFKGLPLMTVAIGGNGGGVNGPAGRLWKIIEPPVPDEDYVKQVQIRANDGN